MQEHKESCGIEDMLCDLGDVKDVCLDLIEKEYALTRQDAEQLFKYVWLHTFGICVLAASNVCHFTDEEISEMLSKDFQAMLTLIKSGRFKAVEVKSRK